MANTYVLFCSPSYYGRTTVVVKNYAKLLDVRIIVKQYYKIPGVRGFIMSYTQYDRAMQIHGNGNYLVDKILSDDRFKKIMIEDTTQ